ncbi:MAG: hypothetical protein DWQ31_16925 [Planctomycetota bacterium]|nr:MAG: hypothetical protein DWQ31_16925 [Planctomycetota bacterium]REJ92038.1 MAG: hypothetical protein DWQ35_12875 [Planctomycetota bacterium]REK28574.1 MAG: hypothetical protein DWQ42_04465 [Planctomycetota bacterium]REK39189.1 MAG: hypothetical protein DWQ46_18050 [Planctomycetota bacterium]
MSVELAAPYPAVQTISVLPNPQFGDGEATTDDVSTQRAMDGTLYTYVKSKGSRRRITLPMEISRMKGLELRAFIQSYYASKIRLTDHLGQVWVGNLVNNPFEFSTTKRSVASPGGEMQTIQIEFEGVKQ